MKRIAHYSLTYLILINSCSCPGTLERFHELNEGIDRANELSKVQRENRKLIANSEVRMVYEIVDSFIHITNNYKKAIISASGGWIDNNGNHHKGGDWEPGNGELFNAISLNASTKIMVDSGGGIALRNQIKLTRLKLLDFVTDSTKKKKISEQLPLVFSYHHVNETDSAWSENNFMRVPVVAAITLLNKFMNDAYNSEMQIIDYLFAQQAAQIKKDSALAK